MRIEIAGAQVTDAVVETLDTLQNTPEIIQAYTAELDRIAREILLAASTPEADTQTLARLRTLQMMRRDLLAITTPPDVDDPANDVPTASF